MTHAWPPLLALSFASDPAAAAPGAGAVEGHGRAEIAVRPGGTPEARRARLNRPGRAAKAFGLDEDGHDAPA
jgi:hypothetical protein